MTALTTAGLAQSIREDWGVGAMIYVDHPDGPVYAWSGVNTLKFGGNLYQGVGLFAKLTGIGGSKKLGVRTLTFLIAGVPPQAAKWLNSDVQGRAAKAWIVGLKPNGRINGQPWQLVDGTCDIQTLDPDAGMIALTVLEPVWSIERAQNLSLTPQWIKSVYGAEITGLDDVPGMRSKHVNWTKTE